MIKIGFFFLTGFFFLVLNAGPIRASESDGSIDPVNKFAWSETLGWLNFAAAQGNIHVTDAGLTGFIWNENFGWIILAPENAGVRNDGEGDLSGWAWGEGIGYIDFSAVSIDTEGFFHGVAEGEISGDIIFNCDDSEICGSSNFKVRTDWHPLRSRTPDTERSIPDPEPEIIPIPENNGGFSRSVWGRILQPPAPQHSSAPEGEVLPTQHWSEPYFLLLRSLPTSPECEQTTIFPDAEINRAEVVKMAICRFGYPLQEATEEIAFPDIDPAHWAMTFITTAKANGIIHGYGDGTFQPEKTISRAEALKIFCLAAGLPVFSSAPSNSFPDVDPNAWYFDVVQYVAQHGIVVGYGDGKFRPEQAITWAEAAKIAVKAGSLENSARNN